MPLTYVPFLAQGGLHKPRTKVDVTSCYVLRKDDFRQNTFALSPKVGHPPITRDTAARPSEIHAHVYVCVPARVEQDKNKKAYFFSAPDRQTAEEWMDAIKTQQMPLPKPSGVCHPSSPPCSLSLSLAYLSI
jgi:hypothetical protein